MSKLVEFVCAGCGLTTAKKRENVNPHAVNNFCTRSCQFKSQRTAKIVSCTQCGENIVKLPNQLKKRKNHFCTSSCAATYNNTHKTKGIRISKLENWLAAQLRLLYPTTEIHFNRKDTINSELDIYFPELQLAFELNGIFHYEPIYGTEKLSQIKNNDDRKFQACLERGIELCILDISSQKRFTPDSSQKFLDIITSVIGKKQS
jgi:hypothetical protein